MMMIYIADVDNVLFLKDLDKIILTGRGIKLLDKLKKEKEITICEECAPNIQYDKRITYFGMAVLVKDGKAKLLVECDKNTIDGAIWFLSLIKSLMKGEEKELTETETGPLHCLRKHILGAEEGIDEVILKLLSKGIDPQVFLVARAKIFDIYFRIMRLIYRKIESKKERIEELNNITDEIREVRKMLAKFVYSRELDQYTLEDERRIEKHLVHAEEHAIEARLYEEGLSFCEVCEEETK